MATGSVAAVQFPVMVVRGSVKKSQEEEEVMVALLPLQTAAPAVTGGAGFTVTAMLAWLTQPVALVPLMVYVVVEVGDKEAVLPAGEPLAVTPVAGDQL